MAQHEIKIPFAGFYESKWSGAIDFEESQYIENYESESAEEYNRGNYEYESNWPEPLRLKLWEHLYSATDYSACYARVAREYVECFDSVVGKLLGMDRSGWRWRWYGASRRRERCSAPSLGLKFSAMTSPREYNFETDRLFATVSGATVKRLFALSRADKHETLARVIDRRHSSRSGFCSFYSDDIAEWLAKPLLDWDHNELETLLVTCIEIHSGESDSDSLEWRIYEAWDSGNSEASAAWEAGVDWPEFERRKTEARQELLADWIDSDGAAARLWIESHPDVAAPLVPGNWEGAATLAYRCPFTPDMVANLDGAA